MKNITSMKSCKILCLICALALCGLAVSSCSKSKEVADSKAAVLNIATGEPESVGFSSKRLEALHALMQQAVDKKQVSGAVTILARHGKVIDYGAYGQKDIARGTPMTKDAIFRDYSMTKPVTGVAMMILYEQGKWLPGDPIAKYIPEFAHLKVFKGVDAVGNPVLEDPLHPPTMQELMTHTAGFTYGIFGNTPVDKMYQKAGVMESKSLQEMIDKLAKIPLLYQPGSRWVYSVSVDVQGYIVEKLSGRSLPDFMRQHIFDPLGMMDAGFFVPPEKRSRFVTLYRGNEKGEMVPNGPGNMWDNDYAIQPGMPSGGGGLVSTAEDYFRFAQMLSNGGELNGVRILSPASLRLMSSNHLASHLLTGEFGIGPLTMRAGFGFGYDCAVEFDPPVASLPEGPGTFFWEGAAGTWFWIDPANDVVFVGMIQRMATDPGAPILDSLSRPVVYQALTNPKT